MEDNDSAAAKPGPESTETCTSDSALNRGEMIGDYRIVRKLGEGGMGIVFEAEQQHPHRPVALKVIRGGRYVSEQEVKLFRREAQALARLKHPAIAAIYENGRTSDGQHFFAMELVRGEPLSKLVSEAKETGVAPGLPGMEGRLQLFLRICDAVNYAHQRGVIHRDLKPGNIMVARGSSSTDPSLHPAPEIKILDFGLARITETDLTATTVHSEAGALCGTLPYMSPEQARGNPDEIDVRSDVYALGVILYQMMLGQLPLDLEGMPIHEIVQAICQKPPQRPRQAWLDSHWKGREGGMWVDRDLEIIMLKALEKDPNRRYQSALAMAEDVQRYLDDQPILARSPSVTYQLQKLVARHKAGFAFVASLLVLLVGFAGAMVIQAGRIAAERDRANEEALTAQQVTDFLVNLFKVSDPSEAKGNAITAREILDTGAEKIDQELGGQPLVKARLMNIMGNVYINLGLYAEARPLLEEGLEIRQESLGSETEEVAQSLESVGNLLQKLGEHEEALSFLERSLAVREEILGPADPAVASTLNNLGNLLHSTGDLDQSRDYYERSIAVWEEASGPEHMDVTSPLNNLGLLLHSMGDYEGARAQYERCLAIKELNLDSDHPELSATLHNLGMLAGELGDFAGARGYYERTLAIDEKALGLEHPDVAITLRSVAILYAREGDFEEARPLFERVLEIDEKVFGPSSDKVGSDVSNLGHLNLDMGNYEAARELLERGMAIKEEALGSDHYMIANDLVGLARASLGMNEPEEARSLFERALVIREDGLGPDHPLVADVLSRLASLLAEQGDPEAALPLCERALHIREEKLGQDHPKVADTLELYADLLRETGDVTRADQVEARAEEIRAGQLDQSVE